MTPTSLSPLKPAELAENYAALYWEWMRAIGIAPATQDESDEITRIATAAADYIAVNAAHAPLGDYLETFDNLTRRGFDPSVVANMVDIVAAFEDERWSEARHGAHQ